MLGFTCHTRNCIGLKASGHYLEVATNGSWPLLEYPLYAISFSPTVS